MQVADGGENLSKQKNYYCGDGHGSDAELWFGGVDSKRIIENEVLAVSIEINRGSSLGFLGSQNQKRGTCTNLNCSNIYQTFVKMNTNTSSDLLLPSLTKTSLEL